MANRSFLFAPSAGLAPVFGLRREIDRLFDDAFGGSGAGERGTRAATFAPPVDVREDEREILIQLDLPGVHADKVEISLDNGVLTVRGERQHERKEGDERRWHVMERSHGLFVRTFQLPAGVDESQIKAEFEDGVLTIHVPRPAQPQPRRIEVTHGSGQRASVGTGGAAGAASGGARGTRAGGSAEGARAEPMAASAPPSSSRGESRQGESSRQGEPRQGEGR